MISGGPEGQPQITRKNESEAYLPVSALRGLIAQSSLLKFQKEELERGLTELAKTQDKTDLPTYLAVRAVIEGLLGVSFSQLSTEEQSKIEHELHRYGVSDFDSTQV